MDVIEGVKILIYGMGGIFFFSGFMYIMIKLLVEVFKDNE
ncbi:MAG: OadG-related small transporter subunit [Cellulosilyticaceae bacterium]